MKKKKSFDCVQMKWDIQQKLMKEYEGLTLEERKKLMEQKILADPILGPWYRKVRQQSAAPSAVAESKATYTVTKKRRK